MKYFKIFISLVIMLWLSSSWAANDIQQGIHGMKWGSLVSEHPELTRVHAVGQATYYVNANMAYQTANQPIPGLFYGFYRDQFFAVFIKLRSPDQFSQLERQFSTKHGKPKTTYYPAPRQTVHRWKEADVKIKLKMKDSTREYKLAIYNAPLAEKWNQDLMEDAASEVYDKSTPTPDANARSAPLLDY
jgi:hypothetical protein